MAKRIYAECRHCGKKIEQVTWFPQIVPYWLHWENDRSECRPVTRAEPDPRLLRAALDGEA